MNRLFSRDSAAAVWSTAAVVASIGYVVFVACTFKIEPVVNVYDASVNIGPIVICGDAGAQ